MESILATSNDENGGDPKFCNMQNMILINKNFA